MCGITGFCDFNGQLREEVLIKMTNTLTHRGPDANGYRVFQTDKYAIGLGHRRLSIMDLSEKGTQPFLRHGVSVVFNGEIYNFKEIRSQLEAIGYSFDSDTDTEVIIAAYKAWGMDSLQKFVGMFAYALYDPSTEKIFLVKDRVGVKPLYVYHRNNIILFSSELKAFHENPLFKKEIDNHALALYLQYSYIPTPHCIFRDTQKIKPGHYIEVDLLNKQLKEVKYWDVNDAYNTPKLNISFEEAVAETNERLIKAFNYRMVADVPVGVFLSGGYDSTAVTSILQSSRTEKIKTFTIGFHEAKFNEAEEAKKIAQRLGTDHTEYYCTAQDATNVFQQLPFVYDEPFADNSVVPTILVSQLARKTVTVALSGDGGDEIFAGYNKFNQAVSYTTKMPHAVQSVLAALMAQVNPNHIPYFKNTHNFQSRFEKMQRIWKTHSPFVALKAISQYITEMETRQLLSVDFQNAHTYFDDESLLLDSNDALNKLLAIDYKTFLMDNNLVKIDRASMSVGLEGREPFLDQHIIEFVACLPSHYKIRDGVNKAILKEIVHKYVDRSLMDRPKMPFIAPLTVWFRNELKSLLHDHLNYDVLTSQKIFNAKKVVEWKDLYLSGKAISHQKIWNILLFQLWYNRWMK